jgi:hypothetical protein
MEDFRASAYLRDQLAELDQDDDAPSESFEAISAEDSAAIRKLQEMLLESLAGLSSQECERVHRAFSELGDTCEYMLDDYFARHLVDEVPAIVARILRFEPVVVPDVPTGPANVYLREAVRCYVFGLNQGAVTLARAAIEQGLRERVPYAGRERWSLDELINAAARFKALDAAHLQMARDVQRWGNDVLHSKPCTSDVACEALTKARAVLESLFGRSQ